MKLRKPLLAAAAAAGAWIALAGTASAAFPDLSNCPRSTPGVDGCVQIRNNAGSYFDIKGFRVPLGPDTLEIRGGLDYDGSSPDPNEPRFIPPAGSTGIYARSVPVPGGLIGIDLPIGLNMVTATTELAGSPSAIRLNTLTSRLSLPVKVRLSNPLIGSNCHIGSNASPVRLNMITGTTNPPAPNRPISGRPGTIGIAGSIVTLTGATNVDNAFSVPGASSCGFFPIGVLVDLLVNAKMRLPSAAGNNAMVINNDVALGP